MKRPPFVHTERSYVNIYTDVLIALIPVLIWSVYVFGARVITLVSVSVICSLIFEIASSIAVREIRRKAGRQTSFRPAEGPDLCTSVITAVLSVFMLPVASPLYVPFFCSFFSIIIAKKLFGGTGRNLFNPAVFGAAFTKLFFAAANVFTEPLAYFNALQFRLDAALVEDYRVFSPIELMLRGNIFEDASTQHFYGISAGNIGEIAVVAILIGGIYLFARKLIDMKAGVAMAATVFLYTFFFPMEGVGSEPIDFALTNVLSGGLIFAAVFALNDITTTPRSGSGKVVFGVGCGVLTVFFRYNLGIDGVLWSILIMNLFTPMIRHIFRSAPYGMLREMTIFRRLKPHSSSNRR